MKKLVLGAAAAAMTLTTFAASAASAHDRDGGRDHRGAYARTYDGARYRSNGDRGYAYGNAWRYDRSRYDHDRGDTAGAAIMGGIVGLMLGAALSDHASQPAYTYSYGPYSYGSYGYGSYGYGSYGYGSYGY
jgi:hypothetical protein